MTNLMRMLETYSRRAKQEEDKITAATQQEEIIRKELEAARAIHHVKKQDLAEARAKWGELTSELQQKTATINACKAANDSTKQEITTTQQRRQHLQQDLQAMQEVFVASCAQLDTEAHVLLEQLHSSTAIGCLRECPMSFCDAHGSKLAAAPGSAFLGLGKADVEQDTTEEMGVLGSAGLLFSGGHTALQHWTHNEAVSAGTSDVQPA